MYLRSHGGTQSKINSLNKHFFKDTTKQHQNPTPTILPSRIMPSNKTPPVIDFSDFLSGDEQRMKHCTAQIREACTTQGFFQIINHDIPLSLQKDMFKASKEFFALDKVDKMKLNKSKV